MKEEGTFESMNSRQRVRRLDKECHLVRNRHLPILYTLDCEVAKFRNLKLGNTDEEIIQNLSNIRLQYPRNFA